MAEKEVLTPCAEGGFVCMPREEFEKIIENSVKKGVEQALSTQDMTEVKNLLDAWRLTKATAWQTVVRIITTAFLALLAFGFLERIKK